MKFHLVFPAIVLGGSIVAALPASADPFFFSTGAPDGLLASASRPDSPGKLEIETGDDFVLTGQTHLTNATFTGLIPLGVSLSSVNQVIVEVYRVFPKDSTVPPSGNVPHARTARRTFRGLRLGEQDGESASIPTNPCARRHPDRLYSLR